MTQLQVLKYRTAASELLEQGFAEAAARDSRQASEKGWRAAAIAVKAVAEGRGWSHGSHDDLFAAVSRLALELPEAGLFTDFQVAASLHQNFYEGWQTPEMVEHGLEQARRFVETVTGLATE